MSNAEVSLGPCSHSQDIETNFEEQTKWIGEKYGAVSHQNSATRGNAMCAVSKKGNQIRLLSAET